MAYQGGSADGGVIFSIGTNGQGFTALYSFRGGSSDGQLPRGSVIFSGNTLYGMTSAGTLYADGVIFAYGL